MEKVKIQRKKHIKTKDTINLSAYFKIYIILILIIISSIYKKETNHLHIYKIHIVQHENNE